MHTLLASGQQSGPRVGQFDFQFGFIPAPQPRSLGDRAGQIQHILPFEISLLCYIINVTKASRRGRAQHGRDFGRCPDVKLPLFAFAVGIFCTIETTRVIGHRS